MSSRPRRRLSFFPLMTCLIVALMLQGIPTSSAARSHTSVVVGAQPRYDTYDAAHQFVYVSNYGGDSVSVIHGTTNIKNITLPKGSCPDGLAYSPADNNVYVADFCTNSISIISGKSLVATFTDPSFNGPLAVAFDPYKNEMAVTNFFGNTVTFFSGTHVDFVDSMTGGLDEPNAIAFSPLGAVLYVTNFGDNGLVATYANGACGSGGLNEPSGIAFDPANGKVYVSNQGNGTLTVYDPTAAFPCGSVGKVQVGTSPQSIAFDPNNLDIYVTNFFSNNYYAIDPSGTVVAIKGAGSHPQGLAFNLATNKMYIVDDTKSGSVRIVT